MSATNRAKKKIIFSNFKVKRRACYETINVDNAIVSTQWADNSQGELNMCMDVILDTLLLIIQSMGCLVLAALYVNAKIRLFYYSGLKKF